MRRVLACLLLPGAVLAAGCEAYQDLEGVDVIDPDSAVIVRNADRFPNLSILCVGTTAIITTTRDVAPVLDHESTLCPGDGER